MGNGKEMAGNSRHGGPEVGTAWSPVGLGSRQREYEMHWRSNRWENPEGYETRESCTRFMFLNAYSSLLYGFPSSRWRMGREQEWVKIPLGGFPRSPGASNIRVGRWRCEGNAKDTWTRLLGDGTDRAWWWTECVAKGKKKWSRLTCRCLVCRMISAIYSDGNSEPSGPYRAPPSKDTESFKPGAWMRGW